MDDPVPRNPKEEDKIPSDQLLPLVYEELRAMAASRLANEAAGQTLQPTALVHEAWLRLNGSSRGWESRSHYYRAAAVAMRRILIERARHKSAIKRAGGWKRLDIADLDLAAASPDELTLCIDECLKRLEEEDPESAEVVMLKFFTGLSNKETAQTLDVSEATVERRWAYAKIQLFEMIREPGGSPGPEM